MGKTTVRSPRLLRVSTTRTDGGSVFGATPKEQWEFSSPPDRQNRVPIGNYSLLIPHPDGWVLVDTGPGDKAPLSTDIAPTRSRSSLFRELKELGIHPRDVAIVILTHLRSEHAGGATHYTSSGRVIPSFPRARYIVQRAAWEEATHPSERVFRHYRFDDFLPIEENGQLELVDGTAEVAEGIWVEAAPGPTAGHQLVIADVGGHRIAFMGLLFPTLMHLTPGVASAADTHPEETCKTRRTMIRRALAEQWWMAPVGCDRWVQASDLLDLTLWHRPMGGGTEEHRLPMPSLVEVPVPVHA